LSDRLARVWVTHIVSNRGSATSVHTWCDQDIKGCPVALDRLPTWPRRGSGTCLTNVQETLRDQESQPTRDGTSPKAGLLDQRGPRRQRRAVRARIDGKRPSDREHVPVGVHPERGRRRMRLDGTQPLRAGNAPGRTAGAISVSPSHTLSIWGVFGYAGTRSLQELSSVSAGRALGCTPGLSRFQRVVLLSGGPSGPCQSVRRRPSLALRHQS